MTPEEESLNKIAFLAKSFVDEFYARITKEAEEKFDNTADKVNFLQTTLTGIVCEFFLACPIEDRVNEWNFWVNGVINMLRINTFLEMGSNPNQEIRH